MKIYFNNRKIECDGTKTLLLVAKENNIEIPHICYQEGIHPEARCRLCLVEIDGRLVTSCSTYPKEGMKIITTSEKVQRARRVNTELLMSKHVQACFEENQQHDLCKIVKDIGLRQVRFRPTKKYKLDLGASVIRDDNLCINCGRCVKVCADIQATWAIDFACRAHNEHVTPFFEHNLNEIACTKCGQCIAACPVGAISEHEHLQNVIKVLKDKTKHVVIQTAPSIRASLGENFDMPPGSLVTGKMVAALRKCGFDKVFDTNLGADMTIMEEASEFIKRLNNGGPFPMITTCCPAWIKFMEHFYHELLPNMSTCKSPHEMLGILTKTYYAKKANILAKDIVVVSAMPCTAKKFESTRPELKSTVDYVLTTREVSKLIKHFNIDFVNLKDECFDPSLGVCSGAGAIFGATGGVMEAALRTAYEFATKKTLNHVEFKELHGMEGVKEGKLKLNGKTINFAAANGLHNTRKLLKNKNKYHFIEIMACPGGCVGGGGQPLPYSHEKIIKRLNAIYTEDRKMPYRKSHENPVVKQIYKEYLDHPLSEKAEKLLHTTYTKRERF